MNKSSNPSLRGAQQRSNPVQRMGFTGLPRCARNDGFFAAGGQGKRAIPPNCFAMLTHGKTEVSLACGPKTTLLFLHPRPCTRINLPSVIEPYRHPSSPSLRGAQQRSNPARRMGFAGLPRYARNDGVLGVPASGGQGKLPCTHINLPSVIGQYRHPFLPSLRGAQQRSNPARRTGFTGLLRCARNDDDKRFVMIIKNSPPKTLDELEAQIKDLKDWRVILGKSLRISNAYNQECFMRVGIGMALIDMSLYHFGAILHLMSCHVSYYYSASALLRPQSECVERAFWIMGDAPASDVKKLYDIIGSKEGVGGDHKIWPKGAQLGISEYNTLCDFTHGGAKSISKNVDKESMIISYRPSIIECHNILCHSYETSFRQSSFLGHYFFGSNLPILESERRKVYEGDVPKPINRGAGEHRLPAGGKSNQLKQRTAEC